MLNTKLTAIRLFYATFAVTALLASPLHAKDDADKSCTSAAALFKKNDIEGALEEARWCVTQLEQLRQNQTSSFFKDEIAGYKAGPLESQQVMGVSVINRTYNKGNNSIDVSLTGGDSSIANNAFAAIASFGMQAAQGQKIRIQRRTATVTNDGGEMQIIVTLKSGGMLNFGTRGLSQDALIAFAEAFPVSDLDDSRD